MKHIYLVVAALLVFTNQVIAQEESEMRIVPIEVYACNFNEGQTQEDLDDVIADWSKWQDKNATTPYRAWTYTPYYNSPDHDFDIAWLGLWPDGAAMGKGTENWLANGGKHAAAFAEVLSCDAHVNFASMKIMDGGEIGDNPVVSFQDCKLKEDKTFDDVMQGYGQWAEYWSGEGSKESGWLFFPAYGGAGDFDFKFVGAHPSFAEHGLDYDRYGTGGGWMKYGDMVAANIDCDTQRLYRFTKIYNSFPENPAE